MYSPEQVAGMYNVSRQTVYNWITKGLLRAMRVGGLLRISREQLDSFVVPSRADPD